ncbi:RHS repeat-associated core domain-containing protein [Amycolatopsis sp. CA-161197]|uniref:RHS repeat-associated core domain-containing protein n=1 Tax=Amycolatopsis sp. CA-161197 TaxID=3239922 RepID=UPI003D93EE30
MSNPLIAQTQDSTKAYSGISLLETANDLSTAIESGDWASVAMGAVGTALDALSVAMDPFGAILAAGVSWLMEHVGPLKDALNGLTGNADQIKAQSETWANVAKELGSVSSDLTDAINADLQSWSGSASDAYRQRGQDLATSLQAAQKGCDGASSGVKTAGEVVAAVRTLVRDIISELIGHLISWALQVVFTLGIGLAWVVPQVVSAVAKTASQITGLVTKLVKALKALVPLLKKAGTLFEDAGKAFKGLKGGKVAPPPKAGDLSGTPKAPPVKTPGGDGGGTPKGGGYEGTPKDYTPPPGKSSGDDSTHSSSAGDTPPPPKSDPPPPPKGDDSTHASSSGGGGTPPPPKSDPPPTPKSGPDPAPTPKGLDASPAPGGGGTPKGLPKSGGKGGETGPSSVKDANTDPKANDKPADTKPTCGDPVDVATGQMIMTQQDVELSAALPLVLARTHLSTHRLGGYFGAGWASTVDQRLDVEPDGFYFAADDGMLLNYSTPLPEGDGLGVLPDSGPRWPLLRTEGGYAIACLDRDRLLHFQDDGTGRLAISGIRDGEGNQIEFVRNEDGTLVGIAHSAGYRIAVDTGDGLIETLRLLPADPADEDSDVVLVRYGYDEQRRLVEVVNSSGQSLRFGYDAEGRVIRWQDRNDMSYRYRYDAAGRCVETEGKDGYLSYTFDYDRENLLTRATDSLGQVTTFELDENLRVVRQTDPLGHVTASEWDEYGALLSSTDPLGRTTRYEYDEAGRPAAVVRPDGSRSRSEYDAAGRRVTFVDFDGAVWRREYTESGRLSAEIDPSGARTSYAYDAASRTSTVTDALGRTSRVEYGVAGLPVAVVDSLGTVTRYRYDELGRPAEITDPLGGVTRLRWSVEGALLSRTLPDGTTEQLGYDGEGNLRQATGAAGVVTRTEVAHFDREVARTAADGSRLAFTYDTELRLTSVTNQQGLVWRYTYDPVGRLVGETDYNGRAIGYVHDAAGELVEYSNAVGQTVRLTHDAIGNIIERRSDQSVTRYTYDPAGRITRAINDDTDLKIRYDALGRVLSEELNGRTVAFRYDAAGNRVWRRTPSGAESTWQYDQAGRPLSLRTAGELVRFGYDALGREVQRQVGPAVRLVQSWDEAHQLRAQTLAAAGDRVLQQRTYGYRSDGHLTTVQDRVSGPRQFDVDPLGRVLAVTGPGWSERYAYDPAGNIVDADWPVTPAATVADAAGQQARGNRRYAGTLLEQAGAVRYQHDAEGRVVLRQVERTPGVVDTWRYTWDADDRLVGVVTPDGQRWRYVHDGLGRRVAKQRLGRDGREVLEQVEFCWDGTELVEQVHNGRHALVWDWAPDGLRVIGQTERVPAPGGSQQWVDQRFFAVVTDLVGKPTELVDAQGTLAHHATATLWGGAQPGASAATPLRFPGQYHDPETGLHHNFHRYYDPATGRYTTHDRLGLVPGAHSQNYVRNPTGWVDPLGLTPCQAQEFGKVVKDYREKLGWQKGAGPHPLTKLPGQQQQYAHVGVGKLGFEGAGGDTGLKMVVDKQNGYIVGYLKKDEGGGPDTFHYDPTHEYHKDVRIDPNHAAPGAVHKPDIGSIAYPPNEKYNQNFGPNTLANAVDDMSNSAKGSTDALRVTAMHVAEAGRFDPVAKNHLNYFTNNIDDKLSTANWEKINGWGKASDEFRASGSGDNPSGLALLNPPKSNR